MKRILMMLSFMMACGSIPSIEAETIEWLTSYEDAVEHAKKTTKPIVLFFTGSDWCTWCHKLENEALDTEEFAETAGDSFVFLKLDFPMRTQQDPELIEQNKDLQEKYEIRTFPSIIILDTDQHQVGITGYRPGGGRQYAEHLKKMVEDYSAYQGKVKQVGITKLSGTELKYLYRKAKEYDLKADQVKIVKEGIDSERSHYFMVERYRFLAEEGHIHDTEAVSLREQLRKSDPDNSHLTHYQLACIEFAAYADEMEKEKYSPDIAVAPLVDYIQRFGRQDHENLWRINMIISQVYSDKNVPKKSLFYAQCAFDCAPEKTKNEIALVIDTIQEKYTDRVSNFEISAEPKPRD